MKVEGSTALVTGANRGLGLALVGALREAGVAKIYAGVRKPNGAPIEGAEIVQLDVTDPRSVAAASARLGDVDIVINNAGIVSQSPSVADDALERGRSVIETNFFGVWAVSNAFAPILKANGGGAIVNVLSALSWITLDGTTGYSASKAAAWALTNGLRRDLKPDGVQVLAVHVGYMDTDMTAGIAGPKSSPQEIAEKIVQAIRDGKSELLADDVTASVKSGLSLEAAPYLA
jgi:NAD(P)-dependent dehydrogenase (short-subunit alcohol dehydrogenase family)